MSVMGVLKNPKAARKGAIAFGATLIVFAIFYAMADAKGSGSLALTIEKNQISEGVSKTISAGLNMCLILAIGSVIVAVIMEAINFFKNR
jgi:hypothetical protein